MVPANPFQINTCKFYLHLAPLFSQNVEAGIQQKLNRYLLKYDENCEGVVVSYSNIRLLQNHARIINDCPFAHFHIAADLLSFSPKVGSQLVGKVSKQSPDHLGLLLYGVFNASIPARSMADKLIWNPEKYSWVEKESGNLISEGNDIAFTISDLNVENEVLNVIGTLGGVEKLIQRSSEKSPKEKKDKKEKKEKKDKKDKKEKRKADGNDESKKKKKKSKSEDS